MDETQRKYILIVSIIQPLPTKKTEVGITPVFLFFCFVGLATK
jgi:hypothetical protein